MSELFGNPEQVSEQFGNSEQLPYTPTTEEVRDAYESTWLSDTMTGRDVEFDRWLAEVSREERNAERKGIMDLLEEMIQQAVQGDDLEGLCLFREALWERNDK